MSLPVVALEPGIAVALNVALWGGSQVGAGYLAHRLPVDALERDTWLLRPRRFEAEGRAYQRRLRIDRWKDRLPEAGAFFAGGVPKRAIGGRSDAALERFAVETRRAELAHWMSFVPLPLCLIWNDPLGVVLMVAYGLAVNLPFIAVQRANRARIDRILRRRTVRRSTCGPEARGKVEPVRRPPADPPIGRSGRAIGSEHRGPIPGDDDP